MLIHLQYVALCCNYTLAASFSRKCFHWVMFAERRFGKVAREHERSTGQRNCPERGAYQANARRAGSYQRGLTSNLFQLFHLYAVNVFFHINTFFDICLCLAYSHHNLQEISSCITAFKCHIKTLLFFSRTSHHTQGLKDGGRGE